MLLKRKTTIFVYLYEYEKWNSGLNLYEESLFIG
jgi:hypothetical protein